MHTKLLLRLREFLIVCVVVTVEKTKRENECKIEKNEERKNEWRTGCEKIEKKKYNSEIARQSQNKIKLKTNEKEKSYFRRN